MPDPGKVQAASVTVGSPSAPMTVKVVWIVRSAPDGIALDAPPGIWGKGAGVWTTPDPGTIQEASVTVGSPSAPMIVKVVQVVWPAPPSGSPGTPGVGTPGTPNGGVITQGWAVVAGMGPVVVHVCSVTVGSPSAPMKVKVAHVVMGAAFWLLSTVVKAGIPVGRPLKGPAVSTGFGKTFEGPGTKLVGVTTRVVSRTVG